ncbi:MAG: GDSL-type esterase/lipase family protein [Deltaproteobacteria bacterium]|nr:GDSL-type esterase/lipase family protein [Deltaproteobacteria bacterium]
MTNIPMRYFDLEGLIEGSAPIRTELPERVTSSQENVILAFGDSITQGYPYEEQYGNGRMNVGGYEPRLNTLLGVPVLNWGVAGETTLGGVERLPSVVSDPDASYVLILEGTNDRPLWWESTTTIHNLDQMIDQSWAAGVTPILATLIPDGNPDGTYQYDNRIKTWNVDIRNLAASKGVTLAEQYWRLRGNWDAWHCGDWIHPNWDGYHAMADEWYQALLPATPPTVTTTAVSAITATSASSGGDVTSDGGAFVTARGVCWSTSANPTVSNDKTTDGTGTGSFTSAITGLSPGTTYHVRAYATNSAGTAYGSDVSFTTLTTPTVTTTAVSAITATSASSGGDVTSDGGAFVTARGVCWSTSANPTVSNDKTTDGTGTGSFTSAITGLSPLTTYHVRAYATNSVGTAYGSDVSFESTCSGGAIVIQNKTFEGGTTTVCECTESITIGPGVTIKSNADVTFKAPFVNGVAGLTIEEGARVRIYP